MNSSCQRIKGLDTPWFDCLQLGNALDYVQHEFPKGFHCGDLDSFLWRVCINNGWAKGDHVAIRNLLADDAALVMKPRAFQFTHVYGPTAKQEGSFAAPGLPPSFSGRRSWRSTASHCWMQLRLSPNSG